MRRRNDDSQEKSLLKTSLDDDLWCLVFFFCQFHLRVFARLSGRHSFMHLFLDYVHESVIQEDMGCAATFTSRNEYLRLADSQQKRRLQRNLCLHNTHRSSTEVIVMKTAKNLQRVVQSSRESISTTMKDQTDIIIITAVN